jgi:hypothetical protein
MGSKRKTIIGKGKYTMTRTVLSVEDDRLFIDWTVSSRDYKDGEWFEVTGATLSLPLTKVLRFLNNSITSGKKRIREKNDH